MKDYGPKCENGTYKVHLSVPEPGYETTNAPMVGFVEDGSGKFQFATAMLKIDISGYTPAEGKTIAGIKIIQEVIS